MPVLQPDREKYQAFVYDKVNRLGCLEFDPETILWHYTTGSGLLGIIESGTIHATHVACLNDSTEIRYASKLYRDALIELQEKNAEDADAHLFLNKVLEMTNEDPAIPIHAPSRFFVACFSPQEDDLSQWRAYSDPGGENGYAIGFLARGLFNAPYGTVLRVNYDKELHKIVAVETAEATLGFYREGIQNKRAETAGQWADEFLMVWQELINRLAPLAKDDCFQAEREFRIVHELHVTELHQIRFKQKATLLSRYLPLTFPLWMGTRSPMLPIAKVMIGPGRQQAITRVSVNSLLTQMGYTNIPVSVSVRPLQRA
jgi:DUF2971 family protein